MNLLFTHFFLHCFFWRKKTTHFSLKFEIYPCIFLQLIFNIFSCLNWRLYTEYIALKVLRQIINIISEIMKAPTPGFTKSLACKRKLKEKYDFYNNHSIVMLLYNDMMHLPTVFIIFIRFFIYKNNLNLSPLFLLAWKEKFYPIFIMWVHNLFFFESLSSIKFSLDVDRL